MQNVVYCSFYYYFFLLPGVQKSKAMSCVHYKFKSAVNFETVTFDGMHISVADLKKAIIQQKKMGKLMENFDLQLTKPQSTDGSSLISLAYIKTSLFMVQFEVIHKNHELLEICTPVWRTCITMLHYSTNSDCNCAFI